MRVQLSKTYEAFGKKHESIEVKEPTGSLLLIHGEPAEWVFTKDRTPVRIENKDAIRGYLEACCEPGVELVSQLGVVDFREVKETLLGFFERQKPTDQGSTTSSTYASSE
ncbi:conserved hypothetical protein [uncultured Pleomorphomonas sp.]|uniref:Uncharacterized protein n=1 Tax=uncultured Pleomorphomonas sp. TaxID=442121 RepID=A0A212L769_9HYPH|nr:hypothetical protein [uncultured Pleomorphomonas sp.]SCM73370.1 conserved hypothetical protein [uncultured Pleomorphomonas sp.]